MTRDPEQTRSDCGWRRRDFAAAAGLFVATLAVVLWQNAHLAVLWDLSYVLDSATRMAAGQMPYRDFPFAHAPLTFLIQAAIIRLTRRVFFHHVVYCALAGGTGTVLAWRIALGMLRGRVRGAWAISVLLAAPLSVVGIYCIFPHPSYDCDCALAILFAVWMLQRMEREPEGESAPGAGTVPCRSLAAGAAAVLPLFFKQNMGLAFLASEGAAVGLLLVARLVKRDLAAKAGVSVFLAFLGGVAFALAAAAMLIHFLVGLGNYIHWTIGFAAQRRMPGLQLMAGVYQEPGLAWMLPCVAAGLALGYTRLAQAVWARVVALLLMAAPFLWVLLALVVYDDADERGDSLLALWPLLLILSAVLTLVNLRRELSLRALLPAILLLTINGTLMSQQLWGSTYAIWPLLILLVAEMMVFLDRDGGLPGAPRRPLVAPAMAGVACVTLMVCGGAYTASEERLNYAQFPEGSAVHATFPQLAGMATPGPYLPEFEELLRFAAARIPASDGLILIPGEDPFYFATGRAARFPLLLFDPATDPYTPAEIADQVRHLGIRWLIVKRDLQIKEDPTPQRKAVMKALLSEFTLDSQLHGYDVYRR